jgi:hypothetical protein
VVLAPCDRKSVVRYVGITFFGGLLSVFSLITCHICFALGVEHRVRFLLGRTPVVYDSLLVSECRVRFLSGKAPVVYKNGRKSYTGGGF